MSKSNVFRIGLILLVWIMMAKAGFGILLTLVAVFTVFCSISIVMFVLRLIGGFLGMGRR